MDKSGEFAAGSLISLVDASVQLAPVPMLAVNGRGQMVCANAPWRELTGMPLEPPDPADTDFWLEPLDGPSRRRFHEALERTRSTRRSETVDIEMTVPTGRRWTRWWL